MKEKKTNKKLTIIELVLIAVVLIVFGTFIIIEMVSPGTAVSD